MNGTRKILEDAARAKELHSLLASGTDMSLLTAAATGLAPYKNLAAFGAGLNGYNTDIAKLAAGSQFLARTDLARSALGMSAAMTASRLAEIGMFDQRTLATLAAIQLPNVNLAKAASTLSDIQSIDRAISGMTLPKQLSEINSLATTAAAMVKAHPHFGNEALWQRSLVSRMQELGAPWAASDYIERSAFAFGSLSRLSDTIAFDTPFSVATRSFVEEEFGELTVVSDGEGFEEREQRYDNAGRDPALIAFPDTEYPNVLRAAGFYNVEIPLPPTPQPIANCEGLAIYSDVHQSTMRLLELHLRLFVGRLLADTGLQWEKRRVSGQIRQRWEARQEEYRAAGAPVYELIHYADFNDLAQIIGQNDNWNEKFKQVFLDKEGVQVSLRRLSPLRNNDAHLRPLVSTELLYLMAEATRLLRAIGVVTIQ